jgi:hypothetical protein
VYFGGLLSLSMLGGLVSDLVMLPLLLRWTTRGYGSGTGAGGAAVESSLGAAGSVSGVSG